MTTPLAFRVLSPAVLTLNPVVELLHRCFTELFHPSRAHALIEGAVRACVDPSQAVILGEENGKFLSFALVALPRDEFDGLPRVRFFHNYGSNALKRATALQVVDFVRQNGYTSFLAYNTSGRPDSLWARRFRTAGKAEPVAGVVRFHIEEPADVRGHRKNAIRRLQERAAGRDSAGHSSAA